MISAVDDVDVAGRFVDRDAARFDDLPGGAALAGEAADRRGQVPALGQRAGGSGRSEEHRKGGDGTPCKRAHGEGSALTPATAWSRRPSFPIPLPSDWSHRSLKGGLWLSSGNRLTYMI